jgi:hypothetical protein
MARTEIVRSLIEVISVYGKRWMTMGGGYNDAETEPLSLETLAPRGNNLLKLNVFSHDKPLFQRIYPVFRRAYRVFPCRS